MSMKISFDIANHPENPTFILATKKGKKLGKLKTDGIVCSDSLKDASEFSFKVHKYIDGEKCKLWDKIVNFKLVWCKEYDVWFQITVDLDESTETIKTIYGTRLGHAELGQTLLHNTQINTEDDIARDDYTSPTVLYNENKPESSLLHRILKKAPHYSVIHVDETIQNIQRTFTFDGVSIYDAFQEIGEEIGCLFIFHSNSDENGNILRTISVYDAESYCNSCGYRGEFTGKCPKCSNEDINEGYGEDTTIFITSDELGTDISLTTDTGSVKNCFKLEAGDDLMTATIRSCNPNGSDYIWYISDDVKEDMSEDLVARLESYDSLYDYYRDEHEMTFESHVVNNYNNVIKKYQLYRSDLKLMDNPIIGYPSLMTTYYNTIDLSVYLKSTLMPDVSMSDTNAHQQASFLTEYNLSYVAVEDISNISLATANSVVLAMAKTLIDSRYQVKVNESSLVSETWTGNFIVTNYSDETDTYISDTISIVITDDYEKYVQQKIEKTLYKDDDTDDMSISGLFKMNYNEFVFELTKYCLNRLISFRDACQTCIDILIEQGIADSKTWANSDPNLYEELYKPYYNKLEALEYEIKLRQDEIDLVSGVYDTDGDLIKNGIQTLIENVRDRIQSELDFQTYLGDNLWKEFCLYRREDKYSNGNYISDGLDNAKLFKYALEFIEKAENEIYKSAELQHSIASSLKNLLVIKKFEPLVKYFEVGNWFRIKIDDEVYKLRLLDYEIDFDNLDNISVTFSDVMKTADGMTDQKNLIKKASSMATSYSATKRQASQGAKSQSTMKEWEENGLDATNTKIVGGADNQSQTWDSHGMLFRRYNSITDDYDPIQLKIINSTIAITDDNWETTRTAIGNFNYRDPITNELKNAYGINGEVIIGKLLIGNGLGIYNDSGSLTFDERGFIVSNGVTTVKINPNDVSILNIKNEIGNVFSFDEDGNLIIVGDITARSLTLLDDANVNAGHISGLADVALSGEYKDLKNSPTLATVATSGKYTDLTDIPLFAKVATSGKYEDLYGTPTLATVATSGKYEDLIDKPTIPSITNIVSSGNNFAVTSDAVFNYALNKNQGVGNANKLLYIDSDGNITSIDIEELKSLLGIE